MNRLTKLKNHYNDYEIDSEQFTFGEDETQQCLNKLGQYEDIEELCEKMAQQPVYWKDTYGKIRKENNEGSFILYNFKCKRIEIYDYGYEGSYNINEYGIKWSFNKSDLENV
jgi:hypothetical protein